MLRLCTLSLLGLTLWVGSIYRKEKALGDPSGITTICLVATLFGAVGTLCFLVAALI